MLAVRQRTRSSAFLICLALVTLLPLAGLPLAIATDTDVPGITTIFLITGAFHVATTSIFFFDREFRPVLRESAVRRFSPLWLPALIVVIGLAGKAVIGAWALFLILMFHNGWLFYHYQRQNYGLLSFISKNVGSGRLPEKVSKALNFAAIGAVVSLFGRVGFLPEAGELLSSEVLDVVYRLGSVLFAVGAVMMASAIVTERTLRSNPWLCGGLVLGIAFFWPVYVYANPLIALLFIAVAHGAQYLLMMSVLTGRSERGLLAFGTMCVLGWVIAKTLDSMDSGTVLLAAVGVVQSHFVIDAKVWRLREPVQREIIGRRFDFLLAR